MGVIALQENLEREQSGEIRNLELIALRYTGEYSSIATRGTLASQGKWPGTAPLNNGVWYFALVPDEGLPYLENRDDLDVVYADDRERFAETLLSKNRLPDNVFGRGADPGLRDRVYDALGLEDPVDGGRIPTQLAEIADVDEDDADATDEDDDRVATLAQEYGRSQLKEAVKSVREDADEFSLRGAGVTEMAEWLAEQDNGDVHDALEATGGDD
ncbi:hypothetical protein [Haloarcula pellucida]|uniref:Uncharacterized protein n=1 Tax=Haloarcula pellucida TaxID=1427151 RepID=A0A830GQB0_9EURY|nr:hypothetical protein [Halomicroarcula pellucida]MBX0350481.1 hypothetical protein [Halomicroarcula pellucida]GGO03528.1 hypothetical protein GCM10009030_39270 [Halomicroarcula pellucida]